MLKKLRLKIILAIVLVAAVMLGAILGLFYTLTKQNLRTQSISMMQAIAADPFAPVQPEREPQQVRLPYFVLQTDAFGNLVAIGSSDYDLTDRTFLRMVAAAAQASRDAIGEIPEYSLRYCRVTGSVIFADISSEQQTLRTLLKTGALLVALGLLAFFGLAVLLARSAVRPVEEARIMTRRRSRPSFPASTPWRSRCARWSSGFWSWHGPKMSRRRARLHRAISASSPRAARCCSRPRCLNAV